MDMKEQLYIMTIGKYGNIKQAAEELHLTSPALSIFLSSLEHNLGTRLFNRIGKQFVPTEAGLLYLKRAGEIMNIRNQYEEEMKNLIGEFSGTIHLGIHPRRSLHLLPPAIMDFIKMHPGIQIVPHEMTSREMFDALASGTLDFIITNKQEANPHFCWTDFYEDRLVAILSADHPAGKHSKKVPGSSLRWLDLTLLAGERFILQKEFQSSRYYTDRALEYFQINPTETFVIENLEAACQMAAEGFGVAFNFERYARHFSYCKPVKYYLTGDQETKISFYMVTNSQKYQPRYVKDFMEDLKKYI